MVTRDKDKHLTPAQNFMRMFAQILEDYIRQNEPEVA